MTRLFAAIVAGVALLSPDFALAQVPALPEPPPPVSPAPLAPPPQLAPPAAVDPLTDLMQRVTFLEDELRKSKTRSADKPTVNWMMQLQIDNIWSGQDAANRAAFGEIPNGTAFRRALATLPKLGVKRLIGAKFPLERIEEAFAHATAGRGAKTVVTP